MNSPKENLIKNKPNMEVMNECLTCVIRDEKIFAAIIDQNAKKDVANIEAMFLEQAMEKLSIEDLGRPATTVVDEAGGFVEDPVFLSIKLEELDFEISAIEVVVSSLGDGEGYLPDPSFAAYDLARNQDPAYVANQRIDFLRAEDYDPKKAAQRMLVYYTEKLDLFGKEKLTRDIRLEDIGEDGLEFLKLGAIQVLDKRDADGRQIVFCRHVKIRGMARLFQGFRKAFFYILASILEDEDDVGRAKGIVGICWKVEQSRKTHKVFLDAFNRLWTFSATKISSYHACLDPCADELPIRLLTESQSLPLLVKAGLVTTLVLKSKVHNGTTTQCKYILGNEHGIPVESIPLLEEGENHPDRSPGGAFHTLHVKNWIAYRRRLEAMDVSPGFSPFATSCDAGENEKSISSHTRTTASTSTSVTNSSFSSATDIKFVHDSLTSSLSSTVVSGLIGNDNDDETYDDIFEKVMASLDHSAWDINGEALDINDELLNVPHSIETSIHDNDVSSNDILLGKGRPLLRHPGNVRLRELVAESFEAYEAVGKSRKTKVTKEVLKTIVHSGARFLKRSEICPESWIEICDDEAYEKVASAFRSFRSKQKKKMEASTDV